MMIATSGGFCYATMRCSLEQHRFRRGTDWTADENAEMEEGGAPYSIIFTVKLSLLTLPTHDFRSVEAADIGQNYTLVGQVVCEEAAKGLGVRKFSTRSSTHNF